MLEIIPENEDMRTAKKERREKNKEEIDYIVLKESIIQDGDWKAYKISKKKWVGEEDEGIFITIEKHIARPSSLNKDEKNWWMKNSVSIVYNKEIIGSIIKALSEM